MKDFTEKIKAAYLILNEAIETEIDPEELLSKSYEEFIKEFAKEVKKSNKWRSQSDSLLMLDITPELGFVLNVVMKDYKEGKSFISLKLVETEPNDDSTTATKIIYTDLVTLPMSEFSLKVVKESVTRVNKNLKDMIAKYKVQFKARLTYLDHIEKGINKVF